MALTTYSELQTSVANWLHRADLTSVIPDLIALCEQRLDASVTSRHMDDTVALTVTGGTSTVAMPTDLLEVKRATINSEPVAVLVYQSPDQLAARFPTSSSGIPQCFTVIGENIELGPKPDADYTLNLVYQKRIPRLSGTTTTNWVLDYFPDAYLFGTLCEAAPYLKDDGRVALWMQKFQQAIDGINAIDWYSGSTMRVRAL